MIRLFEQHEVRKQKELDGIWDVTINDKKYKLPVPGCWEQHPELINYRGTAIYEKTVNISSKTNIRLEFKGVSHTADVFWDDEKIAHHYNAFTAFEAVIKDAGPGEHKLKVLVDNSYSEASSLHVPNDYYTYGGFNRSLVFEEVKNSYIKEIHFDAHKRFSNSGNTWEANIAVTVNNIGYSPMKHTLKCNLAGRNFEREISIEAGKIETFIFTEEFENVKEWNVLDANLYLLEATLYDGELPIDDLVERVGFREITISERDILLNGQKIFIKGFNRHEDYGTLGSSVPFQVMVQDLDMMCEINANAVRTCHYPNNEIFLDLCDERGILVWEENHARGLSIEQMQNTNFDRQCHDCIDEMIHQHYNHPSIVIWAILNECASDLPEGKIKYQQQLQQIKSLDRTRPTTFATCKHFKDVCLDLPDIISFNIYSGWYEDVPVKERHEKEMDWIAGVTDSNRPVIVSEFGAGAMYGYRDRGRCKWSEERQADIIRENLEVYDQDERISGVFIWQYADCRVNEEGWSATRVRCHNNKGVVDEYRRPKEAYDLVKEYYGKMRV